MTQIVSPKELAERIAGCYSLTLLPNPNQYMLVLSEVLTGYDQKVLRGLNDPKTGILAKCKYPPSIAEVVEMAEAINKPRSKNFV